MTGDAWPELPYDEWRDTRDTLHMYTQVVGKLRLALSPFEPEWANVPLYVTARGLSTSPMPIGLRTFDAEMDLIDHELVLRSSDGSVERLALGGAVADFYHGMIEALARMRVDVNISVVPSEVANPIAFSEDRTHATYDPAQVARFFRVLSQVDVLLKAHHARFRGRTTAVQFFWGTFDLALVRYSGRQVTPAAGSGVIARFGGDAEEICTGWWPGDERLPYSAFFAYVYPKPDGIERIAVNPPAAAWSPAAGEFILPYEDARKADDPRGTVLEFLDSTYRGGAALAGWDSALAEVTTPGSRAGLPSSTPEEHHA
jgi:Family of unknown function (DUF5996)